MRRLKRLLREANLRRDGIQESFRRTPVVMEFSQREKEHGARGRQGTHPIDRLCRIHFELA